MQSLYNILPIVCLNDMLLAIFISIPSYNNNKEFGIVVMLRLFVLAIRPSLILMPVPKEHVMLLWQLKLKMQLLLLLLS